MYITIQKPYIIVQWKKMGPYSVVNDINTRQSNNAQQVLLYQ